MKYQIIGKMADGQLVDRVIEAPSEEIARDYAKRNGVQVTSVKFASPESPAVKVPASESRPSPSRYLRWMLTGTIVFPFTLCLVPLAIQLAMDGLFILFNGSEKWDHYNSMASHGYREYEIGVPWQFSIAVPIAGYFFFMVVCFLKYLIAKSESTDR